MMDEHGQQYRAVRPDVGGPEALAAWARAQSGPVIVHPRDYERLLAQGVQNVHRLERGGPLVGEAWVAVDGSEQGPGVRGQ